MANALLICNYVTLCILIGVKIEMEISAVLRKCFKVITYWDLMTKFLQPTYLIHNTYHTLESTGVEQVGSFFDTFIMIHCITVVVLIPQWLTTHFKAWTGVKSKHFSKLSLNVFSCLSRAFLVNTFTLNNACSLTWLHIVS